MKKKVVVFFVMAMIIPALAMAAGYDYDLVGQVTAQTGLWIGGTVTTILGVVGLIIAAWKWKVSGNHNIIVIAFFALLFILGSGTLVSTQKEFASALFNKAADSNGSFK